jgi:hypothetical protein
METHERRNIDLLVNRFWKHGFFTVYRKYGTYLPEPTKVGKFDIDVVARLKNKYAIGITINKNDLINNNLQEKILFLATRHTRKTGEPVQLFIGIPALFFKQVKVVFNSLTAEVQRNIKLIQIPMEEDFPLKQKRRKEKLLFA